MRKGFTLIELLIVIAIIAILSIVVVLTLNPAEMLRRSRDSNRISDLATIETAINLYLENLAISSSSAIAMGTQGTCYMEYSGNTVPTTFYEFATSSASESSSTVAMTVAGSAGCLWFNSQVNNGIITSSSRSVNSANGWIPINLSLVSTGAPIGQWPVDPAYSVGTPGNGNGDAGHFYTYIPGPNNQYKLAAKMESTLYSYGGTSDVESTDGGIDQFMYEQGSNLTL